MSHTLHERLTEIASKAPSRVVMQIKKQRKYIKYSYRQVLESSLSIAGYLSSKLSVKKGDKVAISLDNCPEWSMIYFGVMFAGGIAVPIDPRSSAGDFEYIVKDSGCKIAFISSTLMPLFKKIKGLKHVFEVGDGVSKMNNSLSKILSKTSKNINKKKFPDVAPEDIASIIYTSGTTDKPKGVILTHKNFYSNYLSIDKAKIKVCSPTDNVLSILPLHHSFPFMITLIVPLFSQSLITYPPSLNPRELSMCMKETRVTLFVAVPEIYSMFYKKIKERLEALPFYYKWPLFSLLTASVFIERLTRINLSRLLKLSSFFPSSLRFLITGGARLEPEIAELFKRLGMTVIEGYGLTESSPVLTMNPLNAPKIGSVGKVVADVNLKILNPRKGVGEVIASGPNIMQGYYNKPKETEEILKKRWLHTGDVGYFDKEGYLYLTGRKKDILVLSSGKNISLEEVEHFYSKSPFIKELCVMSIEGDKLSAVIVPDLEHFKTKSQGVAIADSIKWEMENLSKKCASYKRIRNYIITNQKLSRTILGKLQRYKVLEQYGDLLSGTGAKKSSSSALPLDEESLRMLSSSVGKRVIDIVSKEIEQDKSITLEDNLELDLGLDSLGRISLFSELEHRLSIKIPDTDMVNIFTVKELIASIERVASKKGLPPVKKFTWKSVLNTNPSKELIAQINLKPNIFYYSLNRVAQVILFVFFKSLFSLKVRGLDNLPKEGAFILCPNHSSYFDPFLMLATVPNHLMRKLFFVGLKMYFEAPVIRNFVKIAKVIPIDESLHLMDAMQASSYVLRHKNALCLFPEGARSIDGEIKNFKKGIGILAKELNVPLIPVYIKGSFESWPRTQRFPKFCPIVITFGKPYGIKELKAQGRKLKARDDYEAISLGIKEKVMWLRQEAIKGKRKE